MKVLEFFRTGTNAHVALAVGADVIAISVDQTVTDIAHGSIEHWADLLSILESDMT